MHPEYSLDLPAVQMSCHNAAVSMRCILRRPYAYLSPDLQEVSSTSLTGSMSWNRSFRSWFLPWQCTSSPLPALCPHQTMLHQSTWSSAHRQSRPLLTIHHTKGARQAACSRNSHRPDQVAPLAAPLLEARPGCYLWPVEYRNAPAALYVPGETCCPY